MFVIPGNKYSDEKMYSLNALNEIWLAKSADIQFKTAVTSVTVSIMRVCAFGGYISAGYTGYWTSGCFYECHRIIHSNNSFKITSLFRNKKHSCFYEWVIELITKLFCSETLSGRKAVYCSVDTLIYYALSCCEIVSST